MFAIIIAVVSLVASVAMSVKQKKDMEDAQAGLLIQKQGGTHPIPIVYGERRLAPTKIWEAISRQRLPVANPSSSADSFFTHNNEASYPSSRDDEDFLHRLDVWCQGPVEAITNIEIDDDPVNTHKRFTQVKNNRPLYRGLHKHGATSQTMFTELSAGFGSITPSMKGNGIAWSWNSFMYTADRPQYYGDPKLTAVVRGIQLWDPRVSPTNSSIRAWSSNPALVLLDYLTAEYGKALSVDDLDIPSFIAAANECDIVVNLPAADVVGTGQLVYIAAIGEYVFIPAGGVNPNGGTDTQKARFTCNIVLQPDVDSKENVKEILKTMKASLPFINGKYLLSLEITGSPVMAFDDDNILDGVSISYGDRSKRLNQVTVKFPNALKGHKEDAVTWPKSTDALYTSLLAEDSGEKLTTEAKLSGVTSFYQAEDLAEFMVRDSRNQQVITFTAQPLAVQLEPNDIITVTTGALDYVAQPYRVRGVTLRTDLTVEVVAQEYDANIYPWNVGDAEPAPAYTPNNVFTTPADMQNVVGTGVTLVNVDTTANTNIVLTWDAIVSGTSAVDIIQIGYKLQSDTDYAWNVLPPEQVVATLVGLQDDATYDIIARYRNMVGNTSDDVVLTVTTPDANTGFTDGIDGLNIYFHIAYADDISGGGFSTSPTGKSYIGTYTSDSITASATPSDYTWAVYAGINGTDAGRTATGIIHFQTEQVGTPTTPVMTSYNFTTGTPIIATSGWGLAPLTVTEDGGTFWAASYQAIEAELNGSVTLSTTAVYQTLSLDFTTVNQPTEVDDTTGNTDPSVTVTRITGGKVSVAVDWSLSRNATAAHDAASPFPVTLTLTRDGTTIKTWTVAEGLGGVWQDGNVGAGEPFVAFGNLNAGYLDNSGASGSAVYTVSATTLSTSYFDLETQLTAQAVV